MLSKPDFGASLATEWDERYTRWVGQVAPADANAVLIDLAGGLGAGRALDIGCGVGAEAIWLAARGWDVVALDVSAVALRHASSRGEAAGVVVRWRQGSLHEEALPDDGFDLVIALYPALGHCAAKLAEKALVAAVALGGRLLVVHHADVDPEEAKSHGFDPDDYLSHDDVLGLLDQSWVVEVQRGRPRQVPAGAEGQHVRDDVIWARRVK